MKKPICRLTAFLVLILFLTGALSACGSRSGAAGTTAATESAAQSSVPVQTTVPLALLADAVLRTETVHLKYDPAVYVYQEERLIAQDGSHLITPLALTSERMAQNFEQEVQKLSNKVMFTDQNAVERRVEGGRLLGTIYTTMKTGYRCAQYVLLFDAPRGSEQNIYGVYYTVETIATDDAPFSVAEAVLPNIVVDPT